MASQIPAPNGPHKAIPDHTGGTDRGATRDCPRTFLGQITLRKELWPLLTRSLTGCLGDQHGVNESWRHPQCHLRRPTGNIRQAETHRFLEWAQRFVLPLTVQHLGVQLVQLAAVHVLALPSLQGEGMFRIGTAIYHRDDELVRAGVVVGPRESVGVHAERQHESCDPSPQSSRCPSRTTITGPETSRPPSFVRLHGLSPPATFDTWL
jgi:hypothetical protein